MYIYSVLCCDNISNYHVKKIKIKKFHYAKTFKNFPGLSMFKHNLSIEPIY